jgi:hypothetical protein
MWNLEFAAFNDNQEMTLALVTSSGAEHGVQCGLVLREAIYGTGR